MTKPFIPIVLIGLFLAIIGLDVLIAPDALVATEANTIAFDAFGRMPLGILLTFSGLYCLYDGLKGSKAYGGILAGFLNAIFWLLVTMSPLWAAGGKADLFSLSVEGAINSVSALAWGLVACLCAYYWVALRVDSNPRKWYN